MIVKRGYCTNLEFKLEGPMESVMGDDELNKHPGNPTVMAAQHLGQYTQGDAPFYYGKIGQFAYIVSHADLFDD